MQSNNPVFRNSDEFNGKATNAYGNQVYGGAGTSYPGYGQAPTSDPSTWSVGTPGQAPGQAPADTRPMTIDSVVQRTGLALLVVLVGAFATWVLTPDLTGSDANQHIAQISAWVLVGSGLAFVLSLANSFKKVISPALVLVFCLAEGVALGALSKWFDYQYGDGIVIQAVLGTFAAFAGTLAAYKFFEIKVGARFRMFVISAMFAMVGLGILEIILSMFGASIGLYGFSGIGLLFAIAGLVLGVFMLILDFDFVENGIRAGLPERESWRAAFGLTVSLVWIYVNLLRILAIMRR
jgi:uncharacterized YccA/Bax inhibitor family protein